MHTLWWKHLAVYFSPFELVTKYNNLAYLQGVENVCLGSQKAKTWTLENLVSVKTSLCFQDDTKLLWLPTGSYISSSHGTRKNRVKRCKRLPVSYCKAPKHSWGLCPPDLLTSPRASSLIPSQYGLSVDLGKDVFKTPRFSFAHLSFFPSHTWFLYAPNICWFFMILKHPRQKSIIIISRVGLNNHLSFLKTLVFFLFLMYRKMKLDFMNCTFGNILFSLFGINTWSEI